MVILSLLMYGLFEVTLLVVRALQRKASASGSSGADVDR
jgi:Sec-independent protein secretion pathway component TatC